MHAMERGYATNDTAFTRFVLPLLDRTACESGQSLSIIFLFD